MMAITTTMMIMVMMDMIVVYNIKNTSKKKNAD